MAGLDKERELGVMREGRAKKNITKKNRGKKAMNNDGRRKRSTQSLSREASESV